MALLSDAYTEQEIETANGKTDKRILLKFDSQLAPGKVAVLPLSRNEKLAPLAHIVHNSLRNSGAIDGLIQYDDSQSIGRRYRRQDEAGTPFGITIDHDTLEDNTVTLRDRDTMEQIRVNIDKASEAIADKIK